MNGFHAVSCNKSSNKFNLVSTRAALEQSMNRDTKTKEGRKQFNYDEPFSILIINIYLSL